MKPVARIVISRPAYPPSELVRGVERLAPDPIEDVDPVAPAALPIDGRKPVLAHRDRL
jgi:hypothetical protein